MLNFRHLERTFWTVFIILPIFTGLLAYDWLPNEAFNEKRHELLSSHEVCRDVGEAEECGDMADVGRDRVTGQVYTRQQFSEHRRAERWRVLYVDFGHGLIGCLFFWLRQMARAQGIFLEAFGKAVCVNIAVVVVMFLMSKRVKLGRYAP
jgi:hypothetical protein